MKSSIRSKSDLAEAERLNRSPVYVALLRGINVGGNNKLPMKELAVLFAGAGCQSVRTYLKSGNIMFCVETVNDLSGSNVTGSVEGLGQYISGEIAGQFGLKVPVILRSAAEMGRVMRDNPFLRAGVSAEHLHVYFLRDTAPAATSLHADRSPGDSFVVSGREVYLHLPAGVARTRLTNAYFDQALGTVSTMRNWRTVTVLAEWMGIA